MQRLGIMQVSQSTLHLYILLAYNTNRGRKTCFGNIITLHCESVIGGEQVYIHILWTQFTVGHNQKVNSAAITSPLSTSTVKRNIVKFENDNIVMAYPLYRWICSLSCYSSHPIRNLFGNPDWHMKWLGLIDRPYPAWYTGNFAQNTIHRYGRKKTHRKLRVDRIRGHPSFLALNSKTGFLRFK